MHSCLILFFHFILFTILLILFLLCIDSFENFVLRYFFFVDLFIVFTESFTYFVLFCRSAESVYSDECKIPSKLFPKSRLNYATTIVHYIIHSTTSIPSDEHYSRNWYILQLCSSVCFRWFNVDFVLNIKYQNVIKIYQF